MTGISIIELRKRQKRNLQVWSTVKLDILLDYFKNYESTIFFTWK